MTKCIEEQIKSVIFKNQDNKPDSESHNPRPNYIRGLITRARLNNKLTLDELANKCGLSKATLNRYVSYKGNAISCPYPTQYLLEQMAGINSKGKLYNVECGYHPFFKEFDNYSTGYCDSIILNLEKVYFSLSLGENEVTKLEKLGLIINQY